MSVDLSQFHQVFFEESYEGLDVMESALLNIDISNLDSEAINEIFRAAHSIKGGSGTFGFNEIAEFTHVVETLLDLIRSDQFVMEADHVDLFLKSVDCIRTMINELEAGQSCETKLADELRVQFNALLEGGSETAESCESPSEETDEGSDGWTIYFKPDADVLRTGNDPVRMFRELSELGEVEVSSVVDELPELGSLDPEACYLAWNIVLKGDAERAQIDEVFEWVVDDSDIRIEKIDSQASEESEVNAEAAEPAVVAEAAVGVSAVKTEDVPASKSSVESSASVEKASKAPAPVKKESKPESVSIRVGTDKIDSLINMVGELVITQSMLNELGKDFTVDMMPKLMEGLEQLSLHTRELQESVMRIRMLPISFAFSRFPRLVHDISKSLEKKVELVLLGEQTELDKTVMERIGDPLVHLVRNSLDHGLESPEARLAAGKDETGKITLNAFHQGGNIVIQIIDDGAGLNEDRILSKAIENGLVSPNDHLEPEQIHDLIFQPGFSTAAEVTDISGRGVGMDVVRRNIQDLNGSVEVESTPGKGSMFSIRLPLTLAILDGQLIRVGQQVYIFPLVSIVESIESQDQMIHRVSGGCDVLRLRNEYVPIIRLWDIFNVQADHERVDDGLLVIVEGDNIKVAVLVDDLLAQQQVVIKSLQENYRSVPGVSGATILGDGTVSLILDISGLIKLAGVGRDAYKKITEPDDSEAA
ncbi:MULTISPECIES: chemotaxis protein CheA [unclassified Oleiphilus]|jgi:two-component system chemotaxis sensor kinase CheA|uniref:chemotaxis protein CheA n=8 Tax=Oleiphilus TaxID=141450 RepID=UPI0007C3CDF3|nr:MULTISPECIES: chemotaxis protein CheA [unclassified Oleiphilus]KZY47155.1 chemotaxis protein CheA [Oleiphilus sp. HI0050]KZZ34021.1 chemotaxis protein CheA [Oleiphilus sp. HI0086]KZZ53348.1 chemotaxis protein CheA [Oleiphilus sp. HI0123]